jgi:hypothetical protein
MRRVLLVSSIHHEIGNATAEELTWLLGRLRPDVLFLEISSTEGSAFLESSCGTLESAAVMRYRNLSDLVWMFMRKRHADEFTCVPFVFPHGGI